MEKILIVDDKEKIREELCIALEKNGSLECDYIIQPFSLKNLVTEVIKKNTKILVWTGILLQLYSLVFQVLIVSKWMALDCPGRVGKFIYIKNTILKPDCVPPSKVSPKNLTIGG